MKRAIRKCQDNVINHLLINGYNNWDIMILEYVSLNNLSLVKKYLPLSRSYFIYQEAANRALRNNHINMFGNILLIAKHFGFTFNNRQLVLSAAESGDIRAFNRILEKYPPDPKNDDYSPRFEYDGIIISAAKSDNIEFLNEIINKYKHGIYDWELILEQFSYEKNKIMFNHLYQIALNDGFVLKTWLLIDTSIRSNNIELFKEALPCNTDGIYDWNAIFSMPLIYKYNLFDHMINIIPSTYDIDWSLIYRNVFAKHQNYILSDRVLKLANNKIKWIDVLSSYLSSGSIFLLKYTLNIIPSDYVINWNKVLYIPVLLNNKCLFIYLLNIMPQNYVIEWESVFDYIRSEEMFNYLLTVSPPDFYLSYDYNDLLKSLIHYGQNSLIYLIYKLVDTIDWESIKNESDSCHNKEISTFISKITQQNALH